MQCSNPIQVPVKGYGLLKVPCGKCRCCRVARSAEWTTRLICEMPYHKQHLFLTLTYSDDNIPEGYKLVKKDCQKWLKRYRKAIYPSKCKYFIAGEYGEKYGRPHYHCILLSDYPFLHSDIINSSWGLGNVDVGTCTPDSIRYTCDYIHKDNRKEKYGGRPPPFRLCSAGIGKQFALDNKEQIEKDLYIRLMDGIKHGIPKYFKGKLEVDKERLAQNSIEQEEKLQAEMIRRGEQLTKERLFPEVKARIDYLKQRDENMKARQRLKQKGIF